MTRRGPGEPLRRRRAVRLLSAAVLLLAAAVAGTRLVRVRSASGTVRDPEGRPVAGASVRVRATAFAARTGSDGRFALGGFPPAFKVRLTAWSDGHYVTGGTAWPWDRELELTLTSCIVPDNGSYAWMPPAVMGRSRWEEWRLRARLASAASLRSDRLFFKAADGLALGCRDCHGTLVYEQWAGSAHALGMRNPRFASMYNGTDLSGRLQSPPTRLGRSRDYGDFPLRPDPDRPYFGPGYKLDFPGTAGNCAACHLPAAALEAPHLTDPNAVGGVGALGSHCDFCHKIAAVNLDPDTGLPRGNMPGVLSLVMMRPSPERQLFFGPYDDVDAGVDTYLPLQRESAFCAPCHTASFWGVPVYESFAEWKASPWSDPSTGKTCQDCHMRPDGVTTNFAPRRAGKERHPDEVFTHAFPGAADEQLLQNAVTMTATARREGDSITVRVEITNDKTGHHVPTDSPLRQMILLVRARDGVGRPLPQVGGPTVPPWGGQAEAGGRESQVEGFGGQPGKGFAKVLSELWTEITPSGAYWNPTRIASDTRLPAFATDTSTYSFRKPGGGEATVEATLIFRRAFKDLMDQKGWDSPDIVMARQTLRLP